MYDIFICGNNIFIVKKKKKRFPFALVNRSRALKVSSGAGT